VRAANEASTRYSNLAYRRNSRFSRARSGSIDSMELDGSTLLPIVGHALDASVAVPVEWSVVPIRAGDGQGLGVFRGSGSARVGGEPRAWL
jgi:hypothetical protein